MQTLLKRQTMRLYGGTGQSPCVQAWTVATYRLNVTQALSVTKAPLKAVYENAALYE